MLTSGRHNAGIVSEPGHAERSYRFGTRPENDPYVSPDEWFAATRVRDGSWWPYWQQWLATHSGDIGRPQDWAQAQCWATRPALTCSNPVCIARPDLRRPRRHTAAKT